MSRWFLVSLLLTTAAWAAPEVLVSVVSSSPASGLRVPPWKEVTGKVASELRRRGFAVRLAAETLERGRVASWNALSTTTAESGSPLGVVVLLPSAADQPTVLFVVDRFTGKGLTRALPPADDINASALALAVAELVDASLVELALQHQTVTPEVPPPPDLPMPVLPAPVVKDAPWSLGVALGAAWPTAVRAPMDLVRLELAYQASPRVEATMGLEASALGVRARAAAGDLTSRPVFLRPTVSFWLWSSDTLRFGLSARLAAGVLLTQVSPAAGFKGSDLTTVLLQAGGGARVLWTKGRFGMGATVAVDAGVLGPALLVAGQNAGTFTGAWVTGGVDLRLQL
jgi:hypothetical protein